MGYRTILNEDWIVGGYGFYDRRRSPTGNHYNQATFGAEAFTEHLDARFNVYIPESTKNIISAGGTVGAISGGQFQIQTLSGSSERALPGFDAEVGYKFDLTNNWNLTTTVGGFYFDADGYEEVTGPRGRVELAYDDIPFLSEGSRFTLGFESQHDDVRGTQTFGLARLRIPFSQFIPGKTAKRASLTRLEKRMTTRIVRDVDIVAGEGTGSIISVENATTSLGGGGSATGYTVLKAGDDIAAGVTAAGTNALIFLDGSQGVINSNTTITLLPGQVLDSGSASQTFTLTGTSSGKTATLTVSTGTRATLNSTVVGNALVGADNAFIANFDMNAAGGTAIQSSAQNFNILGVNVNGALTGLNAQNVAGSTRLRNVTFENITNTAITSVGNNIDAFRVTIDTANKGLSLNGGGHQIDQSNIRNTASHAVETVSATGFGRFKSNTFNNIGGTVISTVNTSAPPFSTDSDDNTVTGTMGSLCSPGGITLNAIEFSDVQGGGPATCP